MRILHTADWHLGSRLYSYDLTDDLFERVRTICELTKEHNVDVLLVAGDVFEKKHGQALPQLTKKLAEILAPYIRNGLHVVLVPGNHDNRDHFNMMDALLALQQDQSDRVHIVKTKEIFKIKGVQFVVIPYPLHEMLQPHLPELTAPMDSTISLSTAYADLVRSVMGSIDPVLPTVFVAHINVAGVTTPSGYEPSYNEDIRLGRSDLPIGSNLKYIALGHIHQSQKLDHSVPCYYSGSIERMNWGEKDDNKHVYLVEISDHADTAVTPLALPSTPFYSIEINASELDTLPIVYSDLNRSFVTVIVNNDNGNDPATIFRTVSKLCPRRIDIKVAGGHQTDVLSQSILQARNYSETVRSYIAERYMDDPDLSELTTLANQLLAEADNADSTN